LLKNEPRLQIVVAGRSASRGAAFCSAHQDADARLMPATFDRNGDALEQLRTLAPDILVDASGPFQAYGEGRYRLIEACIAQGVHYLDLADGSEFVSGVRAFDAAARAAGVYVLSGVSSFPGLTAAVVRHLSHELTRITSIRGGIAPGRVPLKNTLFSLVDAPDLQALGELWPGTDEIWMGAGPVPEVLHRARVEWS
jgi:saccharopine dehydrogenase-like NADP-dependent oxidoreductase